MGHKNSQSQTAAANDEEGALDAAISEAAAQKKKGDGVKAVATDERDVVRARRRAAEAERARLRQARAAEEAEEAERQCIFSGDGDPEHRERVRLSNLQFSGRFASNSDAQREEAAALALGLTKEWGRSCNVACWGCETKPGEGERFMRCGLCVEKKFVACHFCSETCQRLHWPRHKKWHKKTEKLRDETLAIGNTKTYTDYDDDEPRPPTLPVTESEKLVEAGRKLMHSNYHKAARNFRKAIVLQPYAAHAHANLGIVLSRSQAPISEVLPPMLRAVELYASDSRPWARCFGRAYLVLSRPEGEPFRGNFCGGAWSRARLLALSARAVALEQNCAEIWIAHALVLAAGAEKNNVSRRDAANTLGL